MSYDPLDAPQMRVSPPGPKSRELLERQGKYLYAGLREGLTPFVAAGKRDWCVEDVDGNVYLDMVSASASVPLGAGREELIAPAVEAMRRFGNEDTHALTTPLVGELAELLIEITPANLTRLDIALNGTEAIEIAVRMMRRATGRPIVLGFLGGYHGESIATAALGAEENSISQGVRSLAPGFVHVPYPNPYRSPFAAARQGGTGDATVDFIRDHLLFHAVDPRDVAGVVMEPMLGSGGVISPPATFWQALRDLCDEFGWLLCLDEVKTGMGRTGTMFALEQIDAAPDIVCLGKALGGGVMPIGAVLGTDAVMDSFSDLSTGSTWSWLPASCAAAIATIHRLREPGVLEHVREIDGALSKGLQGLQQAHPCIGDVRVRGCFAAIEFVTDQDTRERALDVQHAVARACLERGLLADSSTTSYNIQPSFITPLALIDRAVGIVDAAITEVTS